MNEAEANKFMEDKGQFDKAWDYYDVNGAGKIDAVGSSSFFRYLTRKLGDLDI